MTGGKRKVRSYTVAAPYETELNLSLDEPQPRIVNDDGDGKGIMWNARSIVGHEFGFLGMKYGSQLLYHTEAIEQRLLQVSCTNA